MGAVLSPTLQFAQQFYFIELVVVVRVANTIKSPAVKTLFVHHHVKTIKSVEKSLGAADWQIDRFDLGRGGRVERGQGESEQFAILVRDDEPAFWIGTHRDPRTLILFGNRIKKVRFEIFGNLQIARRCAGGAKGRLRGNASKETQCAKREGHIPDNF